MIRRLLSGMLAAFLTVQLPSCAFSGNVETMLSPPRLTVEQENIYRALQAAVGSSVSLKYPKSGERLSAFTVEDLDGDGQDEAIVFYESSRSTEDENRLRLGLLAQEDGTWRAMAEYPTAGAEVERIDIEQLGTNSRKNLVIRYSVVDGANRTAEVLHYDDKALTRTLSLPYSRMSVTDLDGDGTRELLVLSGSTTSATASATVYALDEKGSYLQTTAQLPETVTEISSIGYGTVPALYGTGQIPAIFVDGSSGATTAQTVVLSYADSALTLVYTDSPDRFPNTSRPAGLLTADLNGDGEPEIPVQTVFYGYANAEDGSPLSMTNWYVCRGGVLMLEYSSYYAVQEGYVFLLPKRWERRVTAVPEDEEIVFYEYDPDTQKEDGSPVLRAPLLRLRTVTDPVQADNLQENGYLLIQKRGGSYYLANAESGSASLTLTQSELLFAMKYL